MNTILNLLWALLGGGVILAIHYLAAGLSLCVTIVGIPLGVQCFKLALLSLWPFGQEAVPTEAAQGSLPFLLNVIWLVTGGVWIALWHLVFAAVLGLTIVGIPFALQHVKLLGLALTPFGRELRDLP